MSLFSDCLLTNQSLSLLYLNNMYLSYCSFSTTYITCPGDPRKTLGIKLPFFVMIIKGLKRYFSFEVQVGTHMHTHPRIATVLHGATSVSLKKKKKSYYEAFFTVCFQ